jgi:flavin-dependent dehydrogenase
VPPEALPSDWDVVVVGAGVAGAVSAYRLARRGLRVLLVERAHWPRHKPCGGCVNAAALRLFADIGLGDVCMAGIGYDRLRLASGHREAMLPLRAGRAISRRRLDALLVGHAVAAGARFLPATRATLGHVAVNRRHVVLRRGPETTGIRTRLVLACDGLQSALMDSEPAADLQVDTDSPIGIGTTIPASRDYPPGAIHMACSSQGYVGVVQVEDRCVNVGAALDPAWLKSRGGPRAAVPEVLHAAGLPTPSTLTRAHWRGTPRLTRRRRPLGGIRVLVVGDAAGYVEPFTGDGMAWALAAATAAEPLALRGVEQWSDSLVTAWTRRERRLTRSRKRGCRAVAALLHRPSLLQALLPLAQSAPAAIRPMTAWLHRRYSLRTED